MSLKIFKSLNITRPIFLSSKCYCQHKSLYERDEEAAKGKKERLVHGKPYPKWRTPWIERQGEWYSKLSLFVEKNPNPDFLAMMQKLPDLNTKVIKEWWLDLKELQHVVNQRYLPERVEILGANLAALHFFTFRMAAVRLQHDKKWIRGDPLLLKLPNKFQKGYFVEAIDASEFHHGGLRFEGIANLADLNFLKWLSLKNNKHIDVWCLDRIAGQNGQSLEYLDISGCTITLGCIHALARMRNLKMLVITDPGDNVELHTGLSLLEEEKPDLLVKIVDPV